MSKPQLYRLTRKRHVRTENGRRVTYRAGDVFEPTEAELRAFSDRLEPVEAPQPRPDVEPVAHVYDETEPGGDGPEGNEAGDTHGLVPIGGGWYRLPDGSKIRGLEAAQAALTDAAEEA